MRALFLSFGDKARPTDQTVSIAVNAFSFSFSFSRVKLSKRMKGEEENGFFFGLATVPAHVEDKLNDAWVQFAEENPCHISETSDDPMEADAVIGVAADGGSHCAP
ncbi:hypothetical protein V6N13_111036 [Hibiscus sabdariffa]